VFECVQRIVVDEDADGALRRQQRRQAIDHVRQGVVSRAGLERRRTVEHLADDCHNSNI
jgi:hypothetical protein